MLVVIKIDSNYKYAITYNQMINMPELVQNYSINIVYMFLFLLMYNMYKYNYEYVHIFLIKLSLLNHTSLIIIINILGLYLFLKRLSFEINIRWTISYK